MPQAPVPRPTKRPTAERRARMATVLDLHSKGLTDRKIAEHLHISHTQVQRDRNRALEDITRPGAEQVFKVTAMRLEHLYGLALANAMRGNNIPAITAAAGVIDRITRIYGLDRTQLGDGVGGVSALMAKLLDHHEKGNEIDQ